jgi:hypothetical protein
MCDAVQQFLRENFGRAQKFAAQARALLGNRLFNEIAGRNKIDFSRLTRELQQKVLMAFVPKKIAHLVRPQMWRLNTQVNLRYGQPEHAPMVTWIIDFTFDRRAAGRPDAVYLDSVNGILAAAGKINSEGRVG